MISEVPPNPGASVCLSVWDFQKLYLYMHARRRGYAASIYTASIQSAPRNRLGRGEQRRPRGGPQPPSPHGTRAHDTDSSGGQARRGEGRWEKGGVSGAGEGMHTSASAHTELPGSNEHMSLRLKAVWQQVFKICNRKATLSGGGCQRGCRGALEGRETDKRERAGKETGCVGDKRERRGRRAGRPPPTLGGFGPNWLVGGASALGSAGRHAGTRVQALTHIYRHASTCVYMRGWWHLSLIRVIDNGREPHAVLVGAGEPPKHLVVREKRRFQASAWPNRAP